MDQVCQTDQRLAVCQEIIHQQHLVLRPQIIAADHDGIIGAMGKGVNNGGVNRAVYIAGLVLFGENQGHAQLHCHRRGNGNAGGLNGQNLVCPAVFVEGGNFLCHIRQEGSINLLIQEGSHLEDATGKHLAFLQNLFFHRFHGGSSSVKK